MDYIQLSISINPDSEENREILTALLGNIGFESFTEQDENINAYIVDKDYKEEDLKQLADRLPFSFTHESKLIADQNWNEVWEKNYFKPLLLAGECLVRAPFHSDYPQARYEIVIEPNMAFGTGNHETTSLMIEYILESNFEEKNVLDMGCGTGILAILASMKGAKAITAIDIDKWSFEATGENSIINNCNNIKALQGDATILGDKSFDFVFANIQKNVLLADMEKYFAVMNPGGILIMSGFYETDLPDIKAKANQTGLKFVMQKSKNNWIAASFSKSLG